jgi:acetyltransferase-like isoleucine patch superfamily enzyme
MATGVRVGSRVRIGPACEIALGLYPASRGRIEVADGCTISRNVILHPYGGFITLAEDVFLGPHVVIYGHGGVAIGSHTLVSMHCRILSSNHALPPPGTLIRSQPDVLLPARIGRDVWLGAGVTVLGGVTIGDGCVVGAGAVVAHDLPPYSIAAGVPAKVVGQRQ